MVFRIFTFFIGARVQGLLGLVSYCCSKCVGQREWTPSSGTVILTITARTPQKPLFPFFFRLFSHLESRAKLLLFADAVCWVSQSNIIFMTFVVKSIACLWWKWLLSKNLIVWYQNKRVTNSTTHALQPLSSRILMKELPKRLTEKKLRVHTRLLL